MSKRLLKNRDFLNFIVLFILSLIIVIDLFLHAGRHITFDGHIHMTTMSQFAQALRDGEFPVSWSNNFANYGLPLPLFAHQLPAYLGAGLILLGLSVVASYNVVMFAGVLTSAWLFYVFARKYAKTEIALAASILMSVFPYRIINIYIRGGLPEIIASALFPLLLLAIYELNVLKKTRAGILITAVVTLLALTHPMLMVVFGLPALIYFLATLSSKSWIKQILIAGVSAAIGLTAAGYYILPLMLEMKYFYQGAGAAAVNKEAFFGLENFIDPGWYYFYTHPGPRGHFIKLGLVEFLIVILSLGVSIKLLLQKKTAGLLDTLKQHSNFLTWVLSAAVCILLLLPFIAPIYDLIPGLSQIQYPWRFLGALQYIVPLLFIFILKKLKFLQSKVFLLIFIALILFLRMPQLYGKNYVSYSKDKYKFTQANLHSLNLNPVWTGSAEDYPVKDRQIEVVEGSADLEMLEAKNASRKYQLDAATKVRVVDYTFYFPGWEITANGRPVAIEFQDPEYRGVITYRLPEGDYLIKTRYTPTKVRLAGRILSLIGIVLTAAWSVYLTTNKSLKRLGFLNKKFK